MRHAALADRFDIFDNSVTAVGIIVQAKENSASEKCSSANPMHVTT
jgi:hypothetical protein